MKLIYVLLFITIFVGCKSKQKLSVRSDVKTEQTEQKDIRETDTSVRDSSGRIVVEVTSNKESETESETVTKTTEYDTSKPVDTLTGKPPILRETESTTKTKKNDKENVLGKKDENSHVSDQTDKSKIDNSKVTSHEEGTLKMDQSKVKTFRAPWLWIIIGVMGILGVGYCVKKKINPLKWGK